MKFYSIKEKETVQNNAILCIGVDSTFSYLKLKDKYCGLN